MYIYIYIYILIYIYIYIYAACLLGWHFAPSKQTPPWGPGGAGRAGIDRGGDTQRYYKKPQGTIQSPRTLYKAPTGYAKPRQTTQRPKEITHVERLYQNL